MAQQAPTTVESNASDGITAAVRDYYEGWFEGDANRMRRALHADLVKRGFGDAPDSIDTDTFTSMVQATENGIGTRYPPERRQINIFINHVHGSIADVHVTGDVYVDYLQMVNTDGRWQILNALWAPAHTAP